MKFNVSHMLDDLTVVTASWKDFVPSGFSLDVAIKSLMIPILTGYEDSNKYYSYINIDFTKEMSEFLGLGEAFYDYKKKIKDRKTGIYGLRRNGYWVRWDRVCIVAIWGMLQKGEDYMHILPKCFRLEVPVSFPKKVINLESVGRFYYNQRRLDDGECRFKNSYIGPSYIKNIADKEISEIHDYVLYTDVLTYRFSSIFRYLNDTEYFGNESSALKGSTERSKEYIETVYNKIRNYLEDRNKEVKDGPFYHEIH
ncbi:hypothetical protein AYI68_g4448 [Smittium mucronatum]|uniref:Uncharacterized protein n=1 Tax=Smittium mucronatum TaxID=133383 RepID=A0A1R0GX19_9FUNG|nr:hypothetical protein AYI68_g4448 [Smittium mucronatum]